MKFTKYVDETLNRSQYELRHDTDKDINNGTNHMLINSESWNDNRMQFTFSLYENAIVDGNSVFVKKTNIEDIIDSDGNKLKDVDGNIIGAWALIKYFADAILSP